MSRNLRDRNESLIEWVRSMYGHVLPCWQQIAADTFADAMDGPGNTGQTDDDEEIA